MWSEEEIEFLYANTNMSISEIATHLGKTIDAVKAKRRRLNIRSDKVKPWTAEEKEILQNCYGVITKDELLQKLPNRSWAAIQSQIHYLRNENGRNK